VTGLAEIRTEDITRVLVVGEDIQLLRALRINLTARGYQVLTAMDGAGALRAAADGHPGLVVLNLGLPDLPGTDVIAGLRGWTHVPIIVLSARTELTDKVDVLDAGADDYVTKPFEMAELLARVRAKVRRAGLGRTDGEPVVATETFTVDLTAKKVVREEAEVRLTPTEWGILEQLVRNRDKLVGQRELLHQVWGAGYSKETNYLRVYLLQLRRKLEPNPAKPRHFITEPGMGYRFVL
jgi:two-component system KDP operon response regulator KdpE